MAERENGPAMETVSTYRHIFPGAFNEMDAEHSLGIRAWRRTLATTAVLFVLGTMLAIGGRETGALLVGAFVSLWSVFGLVSMAAHALSRRSGVGYAAATMLVGVFVIPALATGFWLAAEAENAGRAFDDEGSSLYDECMDDATTSLSDCLPYLD